VPVIVAVLGDRTSFVLVVVGVALLVVAAALGRSALGRDVRTLKAEPTAGARVAPAARPVLLINPRSGGGKAERSGLVGACTERGIEPVVLAPGDDLRELVLDMEGLPPFNRRVYELARTIPPGSTLTYGDIAVRLGSPGTARAVGQALGHNPFPIVVPCHRVLAADGRMGGFSAPGGVVTKRRMLAIEGVEGVRPEPTLF